MSAITTKPDIDQKKSKARKSETVKSDFLVTLEVFGLLALFPLMVQSSIIHRIDSLKEELTALQPLSKEVENTLWKKLRLEWNYNSNHIEGNTLTYGETRLLLMFGKTTGDHSKREYDEMEAHDAAIFMVQDWAEDKERVLTEADIRELNKVILVKPFWKEAMTPDGQSTRRKIKIGDYKEHPNSVRLPNGEMFDYAKPEDVPMKMQELMDWYRSSSNLDPVILAAELHYRFIRIHPFDDGNGRVARLLVNYVLMLNELPPVVIKSAEKTKYLTALQKADVGDRDAFHSYMAEQLIWSLELNLKAAKGEDLEEEGDVDKKLSLLKRKVSRKGKAKSPKLVYKSYHKIDDELWRKTTEVLSGFEDLFSETKIQKSIDDKTGQRKQKSLLDSVDHFREKIISVDDSDPKILGYNIYDLELYNAEWKITMYGLKDAKIGQPITVFLKVDFGINQFKPQFLIDDDSVVSWSGQYGADLNEDDYSKHIKDLKLALLDKIQEYLDKP
ncbi:MAG: Fic family protein [Flavobacteriales bacterium]|nr:Fic family protein [Flavobacteriales bacterium]